MLINNNNIVSLLCYLRNPHKKLIVNVRIYQKFKGIVCIPKRISLDVFGEGWRWWWLLRWLLMYTLRLNGIVNRRHALRIPELQFRKGIQLLGQTSGIRSVRVRTIQELPEIAKGTLQ